jgi:hypothetical protein
MEEILLKIEAVFNNRSFLLFFAGMGLAKPLELLIDLFFWLHEKRIKRRRDTKPNGQVVLGIADGVKPSCNHEKCGSNG